MHPSNQTTNEFEINVHTHSNRKNAFKSQIHTRVHTCTHIHTHTIHTCKQSQANTNVHTHTGKHTHTIHIRTYVHTHVHTYEGFSISPPTHFTCNPIYGDQPHLLVTEDASWLACIAGMQCSRKSLAKAGPYTKHSAYHGLHQLHSHTLCATVEPLYKGQS